MIKKLLSYYSDVDVDGLDLKPGVRVQFEHKLSCISDEKNLSDLWRNIKSYFDKYNISIEGKKVLDVGCGTGWLSIILIMLGAQKVVAVDLNRDRLEAFRIFLSFLPPEMESRITILTERFENLDTDKNYDIVVCNESISHIADEELFPRLFSFLKKGGALYISDGNNMLCEKYRRRLLEFWYRVENGPPGKVGDRVIDRTYREIRREMISNWYRGKLREGEIDMLTDNTVYLSGDNLKDACERYIITGEKPNIKYSHGNPPVNPKTGVYWEKLFNPYKLKKELISIGFERCYIDSVLGTNRPRLLRIAIRLTPLRIKFYLFNIIKLMAIK